MKRLKVTDENYHDIVRTLILNNEKVAKGTNLQNIPSRTIEGVAIRKCFIPPEGYIFVGADLSQAEPRVQAHIMYTKYGDDSLRQIFLSGQDLYTQMAVLSFNLPEEYCLDKSWYDPVSKKGGTKETAHQAPSTAYFPRALMKNGILALGYQQSARRFAESMKVSEEVAALVFEKFDTSFPSFKTMVQDTVAFMQENGFVETLFGRKRRWPEYAELKKQADANEQKLIKLYIERKKLLLKEAKPTPREQKRFKEIQEKIEELKKPRTRVSAMERESFNAVIQGSATSDIIKINGIKIKELCREKGWLLTASIHDEIIIAVPKNELSLEVVKTVEDIMCNSVELSVPLKSDVVIMPRWMEEYSPKEWDFEKSEPKVA